MKFIDLVSKRYSVRKYLNKPIEKNKIEKCIEAARLAPSATNSQPWKYIIIDDENIKNSIAHATKTKIIGINKFVNNAKVIVAIVSEKASLGTRLGAFIKRRPFHLIDLGISAQHFCLQAAEEGLGTCMVGWFKERKIKKILNVPFRKRINLLITIGYPESNKIPKKKRKDFNTIFSYNKY